MGCGEAKKWGGGGDAGCCCWVSLGEMSLGHVPDITQQTSPWEVMGVCVCLSVSLSVCVLAALPPVTYLLSQINWRERQKEGRVYLAHSPSARSVTEKSCPDDEVAEQTAPTVRIPRAVAAGAQL